MPWLSCSRSVLLRCLQQQWNPRPRRTASFTWPADDAQAAQQDAPAVAQFVESNEGDMNLFDPLAKIYFIRLCDQLARHTSLGPEQRESFLKRLMQVGGCW